MIQLPFWFSSTSVLLHEALNTHFSYTQEQVVHINISQGCRGKQYDESCLDSSNMKVWKQQKLPLV